ncbi:unnamed protein product [Cochlearia groenlandica]
MGPNSKSNASSKDKGKGIAIPEEPRVKRINRGGGPVIRDPVDEPPRASQSRARRDSKRNVAHATKLEEGEEFTMDYEDKKEAPRPRGFTFPPRPEDEPFVRDSNVEPTANELYYAFMEMEFCPSVFPDPVTLRKLGIYDEVKEIMDHMGISNTLSMSFAAFQEETCLFLATFRIRHHREGTTNYEEDHGGCIEFSGNNEHTNRVTFARLEQLYGFSSEVQYIRDAVGESVYLWEMIVDGVFILRKAKGRKI